MPCGLAPPNSPPTSGDPTSHSSGPAGAASGRTSSPRLSTGATSPAPASSLRRISSPGPMTAGGAMTPPPLVEIYELLLRKCLVCNGSGADHRDGRTVVSDILDRAALRAPLPVVCDHPLVTDRVVFRSMMSDNLRWAALRLRE